MTEPLFVLTMLEKSFFYECADQSRISSLQGTRLYISEDALSSNITSTELSRLAALANHWSPV